MGRTGTALLATAAVAFPAAALAAGGGATERIGISQGRALEVPALQRPARRLHRSIRVEVAQIRAARRAAARRHRRQLYANLPGGISMATLDAIASCESGGDPGAVDASGTYRGKYQFDTGTWASVGGSGDPAAAPEAEQDYRAALLYARSGSSPWPVCGQ
ncbi:MAG: transglycosylase family protein [Solirubrobacterales bacterium]